ncbi:MAG TPA: proline dehydrogenase [Propionibacterium sp.]|nr:proline dehydrogenase [Propionibacterium sp.]
MKNLLLAASRNHVVRDLATRMPVVRRTVDRFVPGEDVDDAVRAIREIRASGRLATIDHLGEDTTSQAAALAATESNIALVRRMADEGLTDVAEISVKASAIGQGLPGGVHLAAENAGRIVSAAAEAGTTVTFDAEDHTTLDGMHGLVDALRREFPDTGLVLQAMLFRTEADAARYGGEGSRVRLCKGAYAEPERVAHQTPQAIGEAFQRCLTVLLDGGAYPMIATHDPRMITASLGQLLVAGREPGSYEFQMLYGVRPEEQLRLAREGHRVRVYVPYGVDWYGYYMRRLAEKPANLALLGRALISRR